VQHSSGGYLLWAILTMRWTFDIKPTDCLLVHRRHRLGHRPHVHRIRTARRRRDRGRVRGVPTYPGCGRFWQTIAKHKVSIFYTAPTAIRALVKATGVTPSTAPKNYDLSSLRLLGTVGEPINPEAWMWYHEQVGGGRCPIVDTWWQTETGGHMITPLPGVTATVPGFVHAAAAGHHGGDRRRDRQDVANGHGGILVVKRPWPAMIRTIWGDPDRYKKSYYPRSSAASSISPETGRYATRKPLSSRSWGGSTTS
jgi:acetyl-CoA synthetase